MEGSDLGGGLSFTGKLGRNGRKVGGKGEIRKSKHILQRLFASSNSVQYVLRLVEENPLSWFFAQVDKMGPAEIRIMGQDLCTVLGKFIHHQIVTPTAPPKIQQVLSSKSHARALFR